MARDRAAGIGVVILDQPQRRVGVQVVDRGRLDHADLLALDETRHRDHDGEFLRLALVVARHRDGGLGAVAGQDDLGGLVEQLGVGLGDVEAAEGGGGLGGELSRDGGERDGRFQAGSGIAGHRAAPGWAGAVHAKRSAGKIRSNSKVSGDSAISAT